MIWKIFWQTDVEAKIWVKRIIGGENASLKQFPYQAQLIFKDNGEHWCGGSIIDQLHVLTAAHCFEIDGNHWNPRDMRVVVGSIHLNGKHGTNYDLLEYYFPIKFERSTLAYDIAVVKVSGNWRIFWMGTRLTESPNFQLTAKITFDYVKIGPVGLPNEFIKSGQTA